MSNELKPIQVDAVEILPSTIMSSDQIEAVIQAVETNARAKELSTKTAKSRKEFASYVHSIRRSKTALDGLGKDVTAAIKANRDLVKTRLDALILEVRKPLTDWEEEDQRQKKFAADWDEAHAMNDKIDLARREAELLRREEELAAKEAALAQTTPVERVLNSLELPGMWEEADLCGGEADAAAFNLPPTVVHVEEAYTMNAEGETIIALEKLGVSLEFSDWLVATVKAGAIPHLQFVE